ncbi:hypothetical protein GCM10027297_15970 [Parahaliea aestuarii]
MPGHSHAQNPGIVEQQVDIAERGAALRGKGVHLLCIGDIHHTSEDFAAAFFQLCGDGLQFPGVNISQRYLHTLGSTPLGQGAANTAGCPGDNGHFAFELFHALHLIIVVSANVAFAAVCDKRLLMDT